MAKKCPKMPIYRIKCPFNSGHPGYFTRRIHLLNNSCHSLRKVCFSESRNLRRTNDRFSGSCERAFITTIVCCCDDDLLSCDYGKYFFTGLLRLVPSKNKQKYDALIVHFENNQKGYLIYFNLSTFLPTPLRS